MGAGVLESPPGRPHTVQDPLPGFTTRGAGAPSRVILTRAEGDGEGGAS